MAVPQTVTVILYQINKDPATVGKIEAGDSPNHTTVKGTFRGKMDLINPVLSLERGSSGVQQQASTQDWTVIDINKYNYFQIREVNRSYFITGCTIDPTGLMHISGMEDFLETYKKSIVNMNCFIDRCEESTYWNLHMPDSMVYSEPKQDITTKAFSIHDYLHHGTQASFFADSDRGCYVNGHYQKVETLLTSTLDGGVDDTKLCYIITFAQGSVAYSDNDGILGFDHLRIQGTDTPELRILCTKKWLSDFLSKINSLGQSIIDHFTDFKSGINSIEIIPDYTTVDAMPSTLEPIQGFMIAGCQAVNVIDRYDPAGHGTPTSHAYAISKSLKTFETQFQIVPYARAAGETDAKYFERLQHFEKSYGYTTYKLKFEPFGEIDIPANELLGKTHLFLKVEHSLINGQSKLYYSTEGDTFVIASGQQVATSRSAVSTKWQKIAETTLSYPVAFTKTNGVGELFIQGVRTGVQIGATVASFGASSMAQSKAAAAEIEKGAFAAGAAEVAASNGTNPNMYVPLGNSIRQIEPTGEGATLLSAEDQNAFFNASEAYRTREQALQVSKYMSNPTNSTATMIGVQSVASAINQLTGVSQTVSQVGKTQCVMMDNMPLLFIFTKNYIYQPAHYVGKPCLQWVTLYNLAVSGQKGGYAKILCYDMSNFGYASEPTPIAYELEQIGKMLQVGVFIRDVLLE